MEKNIRRGFNTANYMYDDIGTTIFVVHCGNVRVCINSVLHMKLVISAVAAYGYASGTRAPTIIFEKLGGVMKF